MAAFVSGDFSKYCRITDASAQKLPAIALSVKLHSAQCHMRTLQLYTQLRVATFAGAYLRAHANQIAASLSSASEFSTTVSILQRHWVAATPLPNEDGDRSAVK